MRSDRVERRRRRATRLSYALGTAARIGWYTLQSRLAERLTPPLPMPVPPTGPMPGSAVLWRDLRDLLRRDLANIEAGIYRLPFDLRPNPRAGLREARAFFRDLPAVAQRRRRAAVRDIAGAADGEDLPDYFAQTFHYQTDGYLSAESAALYDHQVEVLFLGAADAMRRQVLPPIARWLEGRGRAAEPDGDREPIRLLDVACGTGRFLAFVKHSFPGLAVTGLDLSQPYLDHARDVLKGWAEVELVAGNAESMPLPDGAFDLVTSVYLLHEVPASARQRAVEEMARVLAPGGRLVLADSIQHGDAPAYDPLLDRFPVAMHEPYYAEYLDADLEALGRAAGLEPVSVERAHVTKILVFDRPA